MSFRYRFKLLLNTNGKTSAIMYALKNGIVCCTFTHWLTAFGFYTIRIQELKASYYVGKNNRTKLLTMKVVKLKSSTYYWCTARI